MLRTTLSHITMLVALAAMGACGDDAGADVNDVETSELPLSDAEVGEADGGADVSEDTTEDAEVIYPGYACGADEQCSTGLCYGLATSQGAFEKPKCQSLCLDFNDFDRYCDSDDDCCKGRCCLGCGSREGLCVLD